MSNDTQVAALTPADEHELEQWDRVARLAPTTGRVVLHSDVYLKLRAAAETSARQLAEQGAPANSVKIPTGEDEAALMLLLSMDWLKRHAPHRFKHPEQGAPQADALYFDAVMVPVEPSEAMLEAGREVDLEGPGNGWLTNLPHYELRELYSAMIQARPLTASPTAPSTEASEPVATIRYERGTPGKENDMPKVVSCNWLPDGVYSVYTTPPPAPVLLSDAEIREIADSTKTAEPGRDGYILPYSFARAVEAEVTRRGGGQS